MNCTCKVEQRRLTPGVFNLKQHMNGTETMRWNLSSRYLDDAKTRDAADYDAYLHLYKAGQFDIVQLGKEFNSDGSMALIWNVGKYATWMKDYVHYQIAFCSSGVKTLAVTGFNDQEYAGPYELGGEIVENCFRVFTHASTGRQIKRNGAANCWALYEADGVTELDRQQIAGLVEPYYGVWSKVAVGNGNAAVWCSDEAVMYISESIAADEAVVGNFPTILQQILHYQNSVIMKSPVSVREVDVAAEDWSATDGGEYSINASLAVQNMPSGCSIIGMRLLKLGADGSFTDIGNTRFKQSAGTGDCIVYSAEKVAGKLSFIIKGDDNQVFIAADDLEKTGAGVSTVNGKSGDVSLAAGDVGAYSKAETEAKFTEHNGNPYAHKALFDKKADADKVYSKTDIDAKLANVGGGSSKAGDITITDAGNYFAGTSVEIALQEIGATLDGLENALKGI